jgi:selenocysteine lyase/cysteine desulfurase
MRMARRARRREDQHTGQSFFSLQQALVPLLNHLLFWWEKDRVAERRRMAGERFQCKRDLFSLDPTVTYLNNAAYSPIMNSSRLAGINGIDVKCQPQHITPPIHFTEHALLRNKLHQLINCSNSDQIAIFPSVSYGMATVAINLERIPNILEKKTILVLQEEFPNDHYAFTRVAQKLNLDIQIISPTMDSSSSSTGTEFERMGEIWNQNILDSISSETALVVVPHVHWFYGIIFNLQEISKKCHENNALLVIDGTQSIGAMPFDVQLIQPDALIVSGYKWLFGPYAISFGYFGSFFDHGIPIEESWMNRTNSQNFSSLTILDSEYRPYAQRYNMGEFTEFIHAPMLLDSVTQLLTWSVEEIELYAKSITKEPLEALVAMGCQLTATEYRPCHLFGLKLPTHCHPGEVVSSLKQQQIIVSLRGPLLRIAVSVYNNQDDLWRLVHALEKEILKEIPS